MIEAAQKARLGEGRHLARSFVEFQQRGLLGQATGKTSRQGGEGLWPDEQEDLWLLLLALRSDGAQVPQLLHLPVYLWLTGEPAVSLDQAQRAWHTFAGYFARATRPTGPRSDRRRALDRQAAALISPSKPSTTGPTYQHLWELVNDGQGVVPSQETVVAAYERLWPEASAEHLAGLANSVRRTIVLQALAIEHRKDLTHRTADVTAFWGWARNVLVRTWQDYVESMPSFATMPGIGRLALADYTQSSLVSSSCNRLIGVLGLGLSYLTEPSTWSGWPLDEPTPPTIVLSSSQTSVAGRDRTAIHTRPPKG